MDPMESVSVLVVLLVIASPSRSSCRISSDRFCALASSARPHDASRQAGHPLASGPIAREAVNKQIPVNKQIHLARHSEGAMNMPDQLSEAAISLIERPVVANLATVDAQGRPQLTPLWVDHEGNDIVVNTAEGRAKARNLRGNPNVAISIVSPEDPYRVVVVRGTVTEITTEGADAHIDAMARKYLGKDSYPFRQPGEVRLKVRIRPDRIVAQPTDAA